MDHKALLQAPLEQGGGSGQTVEGQIRPLLQAGVRARVLVLLTLGWGRGGEGVSTGNPSWRGGIPPKVGASSPLQWSDPGHRGSTEAAQRHLPEGYALSCAW